MKLLADYHVHSNFSRFFHGKNTIQELVRAANVIGLKEIAITDHGFKHWCRTSKMKIKKAREIVDEINEWSSTKVLLGIEADIISEDGTIDVDNETLAMLDILVVGYHKMIKTDFAGYFGKTGGSDLDVQKCTNAYLNAIERYPVTIISHLDSVLKTDLYQIGSACNKKGVFVEINNRHTKWNQDQVDDLIASGCLFVVSSDAHSREAVGEVDNAFNIIKKYEIPSESIANVEFSINEKSANDLEIDLFYGMYKNKIDEKVKKQEALEEKRKVEFTETLSPEMEKALREIAEEKGIEYVSKNSNIDDDAFNSTVEEFQLIKEAQDFFNRNSLQEFDNQNEKLEAVEEVKVDQTAIQNEVSVEEVKETEVKNLEEMSNNEQIQDVEVEKPVEVSSASNSAETVQESDSKNPKMNEAVKKEFELINFAVTNNKLQPKTKSSSNPTLSINRTQPKAVTKTGATKTSEMQTKVVVKNSADENVTPKKRTTPRGSFMNEVSDLVEVKEEKPAPAPKKKKTANVGFMNESATIVDVATKNAGAKKVIAKNTNKETK